ncbi:MAG: DUF2723 domain-containing protein [Paludibacteraceae bacterium]|nr:DUF2723 domain-containing protein [Paludibacteraceae bacterium]
MKTYNWINRIMGFAVFVISMVTYALTVEPTASFWDCPEFITTAFKMEVGHPPGAPFFMLTGKVFSLFASDPSQVAYMINILSALFAALTIMFLYFTITHLVKRLMVGIDNIPSLTESIEIIGSGIVGALVYAFSDTFWFNAVEAEVYSYSSFLTALVFWIILKWEQKADSPHSDRFLILIFYIMGISVGVHLLNLLTIPAIALVYYFKKAENPSFKGMCIALLISFAILAFILYGLIPGFITLAGYIELFFVNTLGFPFNSGTLVYCIIAIGSLIWSIVELYRTEPNITRIKISSLLTASLLGVPFLGGSFWVGILIIAATILYFVLKKDDINIRIISTVIVSMAVILLGYSCYAVTVVRSLANPPMDQNSPDNVFALKDYLNREQYGDRPLLYGAYYSAEPELEVAGEYCHTKTVEGSKKYGKKEKLSPDEKDEYVVTSTSYKAVYGSQFKTLFPRMHSDQGDHPQLYESWVNVKGKMVDYDECGRNKKVKVPTFGENLAFFFTYQLNYMYWRYFLWNFAGRQNDIQGHGEVTNGNWKSGFNFIDDATIGTQDNLPPAYANNKGNNSYYLLPLILGIIGIVYQLSMGKKGSESFWITLTLFFMMGIAIVLYLNQGPSEPRERDYAYAGSFFAFAIWVGFGVAGISHYIKQTKVPGIAAAILAFIIAIPAPVIMAKENWDDHDRSNRYVVRDFGLNYFNSCAPNAVIFTNGDNDTFPLWYTQDTEANPVSLDKRVCNLSYLQTDWYIDQMRRDAYESKGLPISWERKTYVEGKRDVVQVYDLIDGPIDLKWALDVFLASDDPMTKTDPRGSGSYKEYLPCKRFKVPVNKDNLVKQGAITEEQKDLIADEMIIDLGGKRFLTKSDLMVLEMIANNNWERPLYYAVTVGSDMYMGMKKYFQLEGMAYRIVPFKDSKEEHVNTDLMYDNMMNKFKFGNIENPKVYLDENILRMCIAQRQMFSHLIDALIAEHDYDRAEKALEKCMTSIPGNTVPHTYTSVGFVENYYAIGIKDKAKELGSQLADDATANLAWLSQFNGDKRASAMQDIAVNLAVLQQLALISREYDESDFEKYYESYIKYMDLYQGAR